MAKRRTNEENKQRRDELYSLISWFSQNYDTPLSVEDVCHYLPQYYYLNRSEHNKTNCPLLYADVDEINKNFEYEEIITVREGKFSLAIRDDVLNYTDALYVRAIKLLARRARILEKLKRDGYQLIDVDTLDGTLHEIHSVLEKEIQEDENSRNSK